MAFDFDVLFYREGEHVVALCLQTDTAAFGKTVESAKRALREALEIEIEAALEDGDLARVFSRPSPERFWRKIGQAVKQYYRAASIDIQQQPYPTRLKSHVLEGV